MNKGAFSIRLAVKDLQKSKKFYQKNRFKVFGGNENIGFQQETNLDKESGPASFVITDPDGNPILFDQHRS